jgi:hypothetical protein
MKKQWRITMSFVSGIEIAQHAADHGWKMLFHADSTDGTNTTMTAYLVGDRVYQYIFKHGELVDVIEVGMKEAKL